MLVVVTLRGLGDHHFRIYCLISPIRPLMSQPFRDRR